MTTGPDTVIRVATAPRHPGVGRFILEFTIGGSDARDESLFGHIADLAVSPGGTIYVFDRQVPALRIYDSTGSYQGTAGRKGQGPGEYMNGAALNALADGRVLLWDTGNWRINVYAANGAVIDHWPSPAGPGTASLTVSGHNLLTVSPAGIVSYPRSLTRASAQGARNPGARGPTPLTERYTAWIRMRFGGAVVDTLVEPRHEDLFPAGSWPGQWLTASGPGRSVQARIAYEPIPTLVQSPLGYFVSGYPTHYAFEILAPGQPVVSVRRNTRPEVVTSQERADAIRRITDALRLADPSWTWSRPVLPTTKPAYEQLIPANDGRIWVQVRHEAFKAFIGAGGAALASAIDELRTVECAAAGAAIFDVFEADAAYVGRVRGPACLELRVLRGDRVWAIHRDADGIESVRRYRIEWGR